MEELTPRQQRILALVVRTYVDTATPVSSKTLQELGDLGVSGATIRNEMAALHVLQRPRRTSQPTRGILSYQRIGLPQVGQNERGRTIDSSRGMR